jgi:hypothetical protein
MGNQDRGPIHHDGLQCILDDLLGLGIDARGCFVENQDLRIRCQDPSESQELALAL